MKNKIEKIQEENRKLIIKYSKPWTNNYLEALTEEINERCEVRIRGEIGKVTDVNRYDFFYASLTRQPLPETLRFTVNGNVKASIKMNCSEFATRDDLEDKNSDDSIEILGFPITLEKLLRALSGKGDVKIIDMWTVLIDAKWDLDIERLDKQSHKTQIAINKLLKIKKEIK